MGNFEKKQILINSVQDGINEALNAGVDPNNPKHFEFVENQIKRFGAEDDARALIKSLDNQEIKNILLSSELADGVVALQLVSVLEQEGRSQNELLVTATDSPHSLVGLMAVSALHEIKSVDAPRCTGAFIVRDDLEKDSLLKVLELIKALKLDQHPEIKPSLQTLLEHRDQEIATKAKEIVAPKEALLAKVKGLFSALNEDTPLTEEQENLRKRILAVAKKRKEEE